MLPNTCKFVAISVGIVAVFLLSDMAVFGPEDKGDHVLGGGLKGMSVSLELQGPQLGLSTNQLQTTNKGAVVFASLNDYHAGRKQNKKELSHAQETDL